MRSTRCAWAKIVISLLTGFAAVGGCTASAPRAAPKPVAAATAPATTRAAREFPPLPPVPPQMLAALARVKEWKWDKVPWSAALSQFQGESRIPMEIRWDQIGRPDSPLTLQLSNLKTSKVLRMICQYQESNNLQLYDWVSHDGRPARVIISTKADYLQSELVDFTYDIADIMAPLRERPRGAEDLLLLLKETIDPDSWINGSSGFATIELRQDNLVVHQTKANQVALSNLLQQLREQLHG